MLSTTMIRRRTKDSRWPAACPCGVAWSRAAFCRLPLICALDLEDAEAIELRRCGACGATVTAPVSAVDEEPAPAP